MGEGNFGISLKRVVGGGPSFLGALGLKEEERLFGGDFAQGKGAAGITFRIAADCCWDVADIEGLLPGVTFHGGGEFLQIAEGFCSGLHLVSTGVPSGKKCGE